MVVPQERKMARDTIGPHCRISQRKALLNGFHVAVTYNVMLIADSLLTRI